MSTTPKQYKLALIAWNAVCVLWGTTYLGIRVSLETMPPMLMGGLRWTLAGGLLALIAGVRILSSRGRLQGLWMAFTGGVVSVAWPAAMVWYAISCMPNC